VHLLVASRPTYDSDTLEGLEDENAGSATDGDTDDLGADAQAEQGSLAHEGPSGPPQLDKVTADEEVENATKGGGHAQHGDLGCGASVNLAAVAAITDTVERRVVAVEDFTFHETEDIDDASRGQRGGTQIRRLW
jgi:hypothetical protein